MSAEPEPCDARVRSHAHAVRDLDDVPFLAYCLVQAAKLFLALIAKRWPQIR